MPSATTRGYEYAQPGDAIGDYPATSQDLAETIEAQLKRIESGQGTTTSFASGGGQDVAVTFGTAFTAAPKVIACIAANRNDPNLMYLTVKTVTTTGFTVRVHNATGATIAIPFNWIAQG